MKEPSELKQLARESLKGRYWEAFAALIIVNLPTVFTFLRDISDTIQLIFAKGFGLYLYVTSSNASKSGTIFLLLYTVIGSALLVGHSAYNIKLIRNEPTSLNNLFDYFPMLGRTIWLTLYLSFYVFIWTLAYVLILLAIILLLRLNPYFMIISIVPLLIKVLPYSLAYFILAEKPFITVKEALQESAKLMTGNRWNLFRLFLSFIGWYILSYFTFGLAMFFAWPYLSATIAAFYLELKESSAIVV